MEKNYLETELYDLIKNDTRIFDFLQLVTIDGLWYLDLEHPENQWMNGKFWESFGFNPKDKNHNSSELLKLIFPEDLQEANNLLKIHLENPTTGSVLIDGKKFNVEIPTFVLVPPFRLN